MRYVIDSSAAIEVMRGASLPPQVITRLYAPELIDLEIANVLRKGVLRRQISEQLASMQLAAWATNRVVRQPHRALLPRIWQLRHNTTSYDAAFVALAEHLGVPLLTSDARLARTASRYCEVQIL